MTSARRALVAALAAGILHHAAASAIIPAGPELPVPPAGEWGEGGAVAGDAAGNFTVAWGTQTGIDFLVRMQRFSVNGTALGGPVTLASTVLGTSFGMQADVAAAPGGAFVVSWVEGTAIMAQRFDASGAPLGAAFAVASGAGSRGEPAVAMHASGAFVIVWTESALVLPLIETDIFARQYDAAGVPAGTAFQVNTTIDDQQAHPRVAALPAEGFVVAWDSGDSLASPADFDVQAQRFDGTGTPVGSEIPVNTFTTGVQNFADVAAAATGEFAIVWVGGADQDGEASGIFGQRFAADGTPAGGEFAVNTETAGTQVQPRMARGPTGETLVVWRSDRAGFGTITGNVAGRLYDATGAALGPEFLVNLGNTLRADPAVAPLGTDAWVVVGESGLPNQVFETTATIYARRLGLLGPVAGRKLLLKDNADPTRRRITLRANDSSISTQQAAGFDPMTAGAHLQVYNAAGGGDSACFALPASGWSAKGDPAAPAFKYTDPAALNGPCRVVAVKHKKQVKAVCKADVLPIDYSLDEASQGTVAVRLTDGSATYCAVFGPGSIVTDDGAAGKFLAINAGAPTDCPAPPAACP